MGSAKPDEGWPWLITVWAILKMARRCLDRGVQWLEREGPPGPGRPARLQPQDWLEAQLLRREAEKVLKIKRIQ
jgi:hypothetical protein